MKTSEIIEMGKEVVSIERDGLNGILKQIDENFAKAVKAISSSQGKVILSGVGKSGIIARKTASTFVSLGTTALFLHPVDGLHGDLGAISRNDVALLISNSGNTHELTELLPFLKKLKITIIGMTGDINSALAKSSDIVLSCCIKKEACNMGLAPTASTTAQAALGDALAVAVSRLKGYGREDFKGVHPAGTLGMQLMSHISDIMITGKRIPLVSSLSGVDKVLRQMSDKKLGLTLVGTLKAVDGIVTDGDLRRAFERHGEKFYSLKAKDILTKKPRSISRDMLAITALEIMEKYQITSLLVMDKGRCEGVVHLHDLLGRGNLAIKGL